MLKHGPARYIAMVSLGAILMCISGWTDEGDDGWERVVAGGFGGTNRSADCMAVFNNELYVGTANNTPYEPQIWRSSDGSNWVLSMSDGFDDSLVFRISRMVAFDGHLYAGTGRHYGAVVFRTPDGVEWTKVNESGFGDQFNVTVTSMAVFAGHLYVGLTSVSGCEVWRTANGTQWEQVNQSGFGDASHQSASSMAVFDDTLFVGTGTDESEGTAVWRSSDGLDWIMDLSDGFGDAENTSANGMAVLGEHLYVSTGRDPEQNAQVWRRSLIGEWEQVVSGGFDDQYNRSATLYTYGDSLVATTANGATGTEVWQSTDGTTWAQINPDGFGTWDNQFAAAIVGFDNNLYVGTGSPYPWIQCEVWRCSGDLVFSDGFDTGDTTGWSATVP